MSEDDKPRTKEEKATLRARVVSAIADYIRSGTEATDMRREVARQFPELPTTTLYRWIAEAIKSGAPGKLLMQQQNAHADAHRDGAAAVAGQAVPRGNVISIPMVELLNLSIDSIKAVLLHARGENPAAPRNTKLTLNAATRLNHALETALKLHEALTQANRLDVLHDAIIEEIAKEDPAVAARIVARLRALTGQIGG